MTELVKLELKITWWTRYAKRTPWKRSDSCTVSLSEFLAESSSRATLFMYTFASFTDASFIYICFNPQPNLSNIKPSIYHWCIPAANADKYSTPSDRVLVCTKQYGYQQHPYIDLFFFIILLIIYFILFFEETQIFSNWLPNWDLCSPCIF